MPAGESLGSRRGARPQAVQGAGHPAAAARPSGRGRALSWWRAGVARAQPGAEQLRPAVQGGRRAAWARSGHACAHARAPELQQGVPQQTACSLSHPAVPRSVTLPRHGRRPRRQSSSLSCASSWPRPGRSCRARPLQCPLPHSQPGRPAGPRCRGARQAPAPAPLARGCRAPTSRLCTLEEAPAADRPWCADRREPGGLLPAADQADAGATPALRERQPGHGRYPDGHQEPHSGDRGPQAAGLRGRCATPAASPSQAGADDTPCWHTGWGIRHHVCVSLGACCGRGAAKAVPGSSEQTHRPAAAHAETGCGRRGWGSGGRAGGRLARQHLAVGAAPAELPGQRGPQGRGRAQEGGQAGGR